MSRKVRVALHSFTSDASLPQRDGVNLAHVEINALLTSPLASGLQVEFHDFDRLMRDDVHAREVLTGVDCVLCNVGPHAHYYHFLRERLGLHFRIVRDIRTALWSCYLLQESLCEPYLRPGDVLLPVSGYSRAVTRQLFPHLVGQPMPCFDPVLAAAHPLPDAARHQPDAVVTLGHVGRLSEDKNFPQMVDLLIALDRQEPGRYRLVACGAVHSPECEPELVAARVRRETGRSDLFAYLRPMPHDEVIRLYRSFDYFLFFSTSNVETLGRVLIEASHAKVPVLAANHAASAELLHPSSLLGVSYSMRSFFSHFDAPMGKVDIAAAADRIRRGEVPADPPPTRVNDAQVLLDVLHGRALDASATAVDVLHEGPSAFLQRLRWQDLPRYASRQEAGPVLTELRDWFCALNGKRSPDFSRRLQALRGRSRFPERTDRFIRAAERTLCDFSNLGGLDMELCNIAGFHPRFWLDEGAW